MFVNVYSHCSRLLYPATPLALVVPIETLLFFAPHSSSYYARTRPHMATLRQRLLSIEDDFLSALSEGGEELVTFELLWDALQQDLDMALHANRLDDETACMAHTVAMRIATLADTSIEILGVKDAITDDLVKEVESLLTQLDFAEDDPAGGARARSASSPSSLKRRMVDDEVQHSAKRCRTQSDSFPGPSRYRSRRKWVYFVLS